MTQKQPYRSTMPPPGMGRRGPMGRGMPVEKPKEGKKTLRRLIRYFRKELRFVVLLACAVALGVAASVAAPRFQASCRASRVSPDRPAW